MAVITPLDCFRTLRSGCLSSAPGKKSELGQVQRGGLRVKAARIRLWGSGLEEGEEEEACNGDQNKKAPTSNGSQSSWGPKLRRVLSVTGITVLSQDLGTCSSLLSKYLLGMASVSLHPGHYTSQPPQRGPPCCWNEGYFMLHHHHRHHRFFRICRPLRAHSFLSARLPSPPVR